MIQLEHSIVASIDPETQVIPQAPWARLASGAFALALAAITAFAAPPQLVADLNTGAGSSSWSGFVTAGDKAYFIANESVAGSGSALWETDGTAAGTRLVFDPSPGCGGTNAPSNLRALGGKTYFTATTTEYGNELWVHDPATGLTSPVADLNPGPASSSPNDFFEVGSYILFTATTPDSGRELYILNGLTGELAGFDLCPGSGSSSPSSFVAIGGRVLCRVACGLLYHLAIINPGGSTATLDPTAFQYFYFSSSNSATIGDVFYFQASDDAGVLGHEWWRVRLGSGTPAEPVEVYPGAAGGYPSIETVCGSYLYFLADDGSHGYELWRHGADWPPGTPPQLFDINPGGSTFPRNYRCSGNTLYFIASNATHGTELFRVGPADDAANLYDIVPGSSGSSPNNLTFLDDTLFFTASNGSNGTELWRHRPEDPSPVMIEVRPGSLGSSPSYLTVHSGRLYFTADDGTHGTELYRIGRDDSTPALFDLNVGSLSSSPSSFVAIADYLLFSASDGMHGTELWSILNSDTTPTLFDLYTCPSSGSSLPLPSVGVEAGGRLYLTTLYQCADLRTNLWTFDPVTGTVAPVQLDTGCGTATSDLNRVGSRLFFRTGCPGRGDEPWVYDPMTGVSTSLGDIYAGSSSSFPAHATIAGSRIIFDADDGVHGRELWGTDGTAAGTTLLRDFNTATASSSPSMFTPVGDLMAFRANSALYATDGTAAGTRQVNPLTGSSLSGIDFLTSGTGRVWFYDRATATPPNAAICVSDLTATGTRRIASLAPSGTEPCRGTQVPLMSSLSNGVMVFSGYDGTTLGTEPWRTDGTLQNTYPLRDINTNTSGCTGSYPGGFTAVGNLVIFAATNASNVRQLWRTDGTVFGTSVVTTTLTNPGAFVVVQGRAYFLARTTAGAMQLWRYDPATGQVAMLTNTTGGVWNDPATAPELAAVGSVLFYTTTTTQFGRQVGFFNLATGQGGTTSQTGGPGTPSNLTPVAGLLTFVATWANYGREVWLVDPAFPTFARAITDINPAGDSSPANLTAIGDILYFSANNGARGAEPWRVRFGAGNVGVPEMLGDIAECGSSSPGAFVSLSGRILFAATTSELGAELWSWRDCVADLDDGSGTGNPDGGVTIDDLLYYIQIYTTGVAAADVDDGSGTGTLDGGVTIDDLLYFLSRFEQGC